MKLPNRLKALLESNDVLYSAVLDALSASELILVHSRLPFFPEYTDHGINHFQKTLLTADALIPEVARPILTAADAAMLIISVLLHDLGMHLTEAGFFSLISNNIQAHHRLDTEGWPTLWEDFFGEAKRFDGRTLKRLFGDTTPVRRPPSNYNEYTRNDRLLIGEFIRRHHARLAHDIALNGFPGPGAYLPVVTHKLDPSLRDLAGLIARSHGTSIRTAMPILGQDFHARDYQGVHAIYLMVLLRISDYLQVEAERAPEDILRISDITSPVSQGEWRAHSAIKNVTFEGSDPEAIEVRATPGDVKTYLRLKDLLSGLQRELDTSWAVLGEVYGRYNNLAPLGIEIRRVRSNLDDVGQFARSVSYFPERTTFGAADADLLRLLVEPLYGVDINIGLRELIQNSLDACRELTDYCEHTGIAQPVIGSQPNVSVTLEIGSSGKNTLRIVDRGIGMTAEVIRDFFLIAGASYRSSDAWGKRHRTTDGHSRVMRSGRFGIGVLAAFLIGERISVTTRHISTSADEGLTFNAEIDSESIELRRCKTEVGTTIEIEVDHEAVESLSELCLRHTFGDLPYNLYFLESPSLEFSLPKLQRKPAFWPSIGSSLPTEWRRISAKGFADIHWTYKYSKKSISGYYSALGHVACNGIAVGDQSLSLSMPGWARPLSLISPALSVFDPDANLPLTLTRTGLASRLPFEEELLDDISRDIVAYCLLDDAPNKWRRTAGSERTTTPVCRHDGVVVMVSYLLTERGFAFPEPSILEDVAVQSVVLMSREVQEFSLFPTNAALLIPTAEYVTGVGDCDRLIRSLVNYSPYSPSILTTRVSGARIHVPTALTSRWPNGQVGKGTLAKFTNRSESSEFETLQTARYQNVNFEFNAPRAENWLVAECNLQPLKDQVSSPLKKAFEKYLGGFLIPYEPEERRSVFKAAFSELADYIERHEKARKRSASPSVTRP